MEKLQLYIESLVFASDDSISTNEIKECLEVVLSQKLSEEEIEEGLDLLQSKYKDDQFSFELVGISNGWQFMSKGAYHHIIAQYLKLQSKKKLSRAALESLAIIAYKQPITKTKIEGIRGVNCDYTIQKLMDKELIEVSGRAEGPGRPLLYATSEKFMDHFGIRDINDLPKLKEINVTENSINEESNTVFDLDDSTSSSEDKATETPEPVEEAVDDQEASNSNVDILENNENATEDTDSNELPESTEDSSVENNESDDHSEIAADNTLNVIEKLENVETPDIQDTVEDHSIEDSETIIDVDDSLNKEIEDAIEDLSESEDDNPLIVNDKLENVETIDTLGSSEEHSIQDAETVMGAEVPSEAENEDVNEDQIISDAAEDSLDSKELSEIKADVTIPYTDSKIEIESEPDSMVDETISEAPIQSSVQETTEKTNEMSINPKIENETDSPIVHSIHEEE